MTTPRGTGRGLRVGVAVVSTMLALAVGATTGAGSYASLISTVLGGSTYQTVDDGTGEVVNNGEDNGMSLAEWKDTADQLVQEVAGEGIVMLKNDNDTLPLAQGSKVTLFGRSSVDLVLGGTGAGGIDPSRAVNLKDALEDSGRFDVNDAMWDFYKTYDGKEGYTRSNGTYMGALPEDIFVAEPPVAEYTDEAKASYADYADAAIVVFSRVGGEGSDMPIGDFGDGTKYLALQPNEQAVLEEIQSSGAFDKVIALINTSNAMELSWVDQEQYGIDACLWIGGVGQSGARAVAKVLDGEINPSGHLVDTWAADSFSSPAMQNFGDFTFSNADAITAAAGESVFGTKYVVYREGIYVGYRYYETRYADGVTDPSGTNALSAAGATMGDTWDYDAEVVYPFGYGLSYGTEDGNPYEQEIVSSSVNAEGAEVTVRVTNTGDVAGKSVVQVYAQQPYTAGGTEKSAVQLVGFGKTDTLEPGASEEVTIAIDADDYSSYDYETAKTYVLDAGDYHFAIGNGAHEALNNILAAQGYTTADGMDAEGDAAKAFSWTNVEQVLLDESYAGEEITNRFDTASLEGYGKETGYLTRADWNTFPEPYSELEANEEMIADINADGEYQPGDSDTSAITTGAKNGINIAQMAGVEFDDTEQWDTFLDQLTVDDMVTLVTKSGQIAVSTIAYPAVYMKDGPAGQNVRMYVEDGSPATGYCGEVVSASTFNRDLLRRLGDAMGEDWIRTETAGAYAPAVNIHRTPYAGRNFEYFSEDGYLSGELAYEEVVGMQERGVMTFIKHLTLNDQETNRQGVSTFSNEQAIREIYLKAFEKSFTEGQAQATMGSFNRIGCTWSGAYAPLLKDVIRGEWGSTAILDTDMAVLPGLQSIGAGLENGNTMWATSADVFYNVIRETAGQDSKMLANLREACHVILYNVANSIGINGISTATVVNRVNPYWLNIAYVAVAALAISDIVMVALLVRRSLRGNRVTIETEA